MSIGSEADISAALGFVDVYDLAKFQPVLRPAAAPVRAAFGFEPCLFASTGGQRIYVGYSVAASAALKMVLHTLYDGVEKFTPSFRIGYR